MPESVVDRPTRAHEYVFLLSKSERYFYDAGAIAERCDPKNSRDTTTRRRYPGQQPDTGFKHGRRFETRNRRTVWNLGTKPYPEAHYATFTPDLVEPCILAGSRHGDVVLDPFFGSGTVGMVAEKLNRRWVGVDLGYQDLQAKRVSNGQKLLPTLTYDYSDYKGLL
jgi:DNA modification methylase